MEKCNREWPDIYFWGALQIQVKVDWCDQFNNHSTCHNLKAFTSIGQFLHRYYGSILREYCAEHTVSVLWCRINQVRTCLPQRQGKAERFHRRLEHAWNSIGWRLRRPSSFDERKWSKESEETVFVMALSLIVLYRLLPDLIMNNWAIIVQICTLHSRWILSEAGWANLGYLSCKF